MDIDLVTRAQAGDQAAFAQLAEATYARLHAITHGILRDRGLAEDAAQQAMLDAWRKLPTLRDPARFEAWSYRLTVNACYAESRRARRWLPAMSMVNATAPIAPDDYSPIADRDEIERGFRGLPIEQRAVLVLRHLVGLPLDEVARVLDVPTGTARSRLHRATQAMRATLEADTRLETATSAPNHEVAL